MGQQTTNVVRAFLQGLTGAGLFRRVSYPGAPVAFVDPNSADEIRIRGGLQREIAFSRRDGIPKQGHDARKSAEEDDRCVRAVR
jgi:hypothetical protein